MSTPRGTDCLLVGRGGASYRIPLSDVLSKLGDTDRVAVSRGGTDYCVTGDRFKADDILGTDLLAIGRGGVDYKCTASDYLRLFGIPPVEIESVGLVQTVSTGNRYEYTSTVKLKSTGPRPSLPPGISWQYISVWKYRTYYKFVQPGGRVLYARTFIEEAGNRYHHWFWGPSDSLYENVPLNGPSYAMFTGELSYYSAYQQWRYFRETELRYWEGKSFEHTLSIPQKWHYVNDGEVPHIKAPPVMGVDTGLMVPDYANYNNGIYFPAGTSIQLVVEIYNDFGARTTKSSPVVKPTLIGPLYP